MLWNIIKTLRERRVDRHCAIDNAESCLARLGEPDAPIELNEIFAQIVHEPLRALVEECSPDTPERQKPGRKFSRTILRSADFQSARTN